MNKPINSNPLLVSLDDQLPDPGLMEANSDGTRSDGEEAAANEMIDGLVSEIKGKIRKAAIKLHRLGGPFRSQTYLTKLMTGVNQAVTDAVKDEEQKIEGKGKGAKSKDKDAKSDKKPATKSVPKSDDMDDDDDAVGKNESISTVDAITGLTG